MTSGLNSDEHEQAAAGDQVPTEADIQATADFILSAGADAGEDEAQETADFILSAGRASQEENHNGRF